MGNQDSQGLLLYNQTTLNQIFVCLTQTILDQKDLKIQIFPVHVVYFNKQISYIKLETSVRNSKISIQNIFCLETFLFKYV